MPLNLGLGLGLGSVPVSRGAAGGGGVLASDDFNRADSDTTMGAPWVAQTETWGISGNKAYVVTAPARAFLVRDTGAADGTIAVTLSTINPVDGAGLWVRSTDSNNGFMVLANNTVYQLFRREAAAHTSLGTSAGAPINGDILSVVLSGSSFSVRVNGLEVIATSDAFNVGAVLHGLTAGNTDHRFDDWSHAT